MLKIVVSFKLRLKTGPKFKKKIVKWETTNKNVE